MVDNYLSDYPRQRRPAIMHRRYAEYLTAICPLVIHSAPLHLPRIQEVAQRHRLRDKDAGVLWLVQLTELVAKDLPALPPAAAIA